MMNREALLKRLQVCDFVLVECVEFLSTHPNNQEALNYLKKYQKMRETALRDFESRFGPITACGYEGYTTRFSYVDGPWPWEA